MSARLQRLKVERKTDAKETPGFAMKARAGSRPEIQGQERSLRKCLICARAPCFLLGAA